MTRRPEVRVPVPQENSVKGPTVEDWMPETSPEPLSEVAP